MNEMPDYMRPYQIDDRDTGAPVTRYALTTWKVRELLNKNVRSLDEQHKQRMYKNAS